MGQASVVGEATAETVIRVDGFAKAYKKNHAVNGINLSVSKGEIYGLIGPDGAGKSSLMKAIAGVLTFDAGEIQVMGTRLDSELAAETIKPKIGFMPQGLGLNLYPELSIDENINFFAALRLVDTDDLVSRKNQLLEMTRLAPFRNRAAKHLSGGMKQKLGLICTLIHHPQLLILDEPTTGVDPVSRRDFWLILGELMQEQGSTALATTAYLDEASRFNQIALMHEGRIIAQGPPADIERSGGGSVVMVKTRQQQQARQQLSSRYPGIQPLGEWLQVPVDAPDPVSAVRQVQGLLREFDVDSVESRAPDLEDAFVQILRSEKSPAAAEMPFAKLPVSENTSSSAQTRQQTRQQVTHQPTTLRRKKEATNSVSIEADQLTRKFGEFCAADRVCFRVSRGEIFGLLGANGAGKTTVIKMLTGILDPTSGTGRVANTRIDRKNRRNRYRFGYMSQEFSLYLDLTVSENIMLYAGIYGLKSGEARQRREWICDMAGLGPYLDRRTSALTMGLRQRLALGCALIHRPEVLFLDEPTSGIDPLGRQQFWTILHEMARDDGVAVLITTHHMTDAERCDHLALMFGGRIVAAGSPKKMKAQIEDITGGLLHVNTNHPHKAMDVLRAHDFAHLDLHGTQLHVLTGTDTVNQQRIRKLLQANELLASEIKPLPVSMEDVFVYWARNLESKHD